MAQISEANLLVYINMQEKSNSLLNAWVDYCMTKEVPIPLVVGMAVKGANAGAMDFLKMAAGIQ